MSEMRFSGKRKGARGGKGQLNAETSQAHPSTAAQAQPEASQAKEEGGRATLGMHAPRVRPRPPLCQVGPASAGGAVIKRRLAVRGALGEYSPRMPPPRSYIKRGRLPPYTHTHHTSLTLAQVSSSLPPPLLT